MLVSVGSRFCTGAESRYAPIEGELMAIVWALNRTSHYTLGDYGNDPEGGGFGMVAWDKPGHYPAAGRMFNLHQECTESASGPTKTSSGSTVSDGVGVIGLL